MNMLLNIRNALITSVNFYQSIEYSSPVCGYDIIKTRPAIFYLSYKHEFNKHWQLELTGFRILLSKGLRC